MSNSEKAAMFFELINRRSLDQAEDLMKADARLDFPKTQLLVGHERILKFFRILFRQYPRLHFQIQRIIAQGDWVAVHWANRGVTKRDEHYENEGVTLFEFEDGRIILISDFFKDTGKF